MRKAVRIFFKWAKTPNSSKQRSYSIKIDLGGKFVERDLSKRGKSSISVVSCGSHDGMFQGFYCTMMLLPVLLGNKI